MFRHGAGMRAVFPEERPGFNHLLIIGEALLVYHQSPVHGHIQGVLVTRDGHVPGRFALTWGLLSESGRLFAVIADEEGYRVAELYFPGVG